MIMEDWQARTRLLAGDDNMLKLHNAHILVAGLGGVGAYAAEQLVRAGIGSITIVDGDSVHPTNRNRQLAALVSTSDRLKTEIMSERLLDINPELKLIAITEYITDVRTIKILEEGYDYVVDAIDTLSPKVDLISNAMKMGLPLISSMGAGGRFNPMQIKIADISETNNCRLAYYLRKRLHKEGIWKGFQAVFSPEEVSRTVLKLADGELNKKSTVGTISYMPAIFGCFCAAGVISGILDTGNPILKQNAGSVNPE